MSFGEELSPAMVAKAIERNALDAWLWAFEFQVLPQPVRLVRNTTNIVWPVSLGHIWYAWDIDFDEMSEDASSGPAPLTLSTFKTNGALRDVMEANDDFDNVLVRVFALNAALLSEGRDAVPSKIARVGQVEKSASEGIKFPLGEVGDWSRASPDWTYEHDFCPAKWGGFTCGFDTTRPGSPSWCSKRRGGGDGCDAKGKWEEDNGYPRNFPARNNAFPGIASVRQ